MTLITRQEAIDAAARRDPTATRFVVRLYDGFDHEWMDVTEPLPPERAIGEWARLTNNGTESVSYDDIGYYAIYPATVTMLYSREGVYRDG